MKYKGQRTKDEGRKYLAVFCTLYFVLCTSALAAPRDPSQAPEVQDVVFFGKKRPIMIRLHVRVDGKPFSAAWEDYVEKRFKHADRGGDGTLDAMELRRIPSAGVMEEALRGRGFNANNFFPLEMADADSDGDRQVTLRELRTYYAKEVGTGAIRLATGQRQGVPVNGNGLTAALLQRLDANKDGKLSKLELAGAAGLIAKLDADDDETVAALELRTPGLPVARPGVQRAPGMMPNRGSGPGLDELPFALVPKDSGPGRLTERLEFGKKLVKVYDKDDSDRLTREEIGLGDEFFQKLDRNDDRVLDYIEMLRYVIVLPDVEVTVHLGKVEGKAAPIGPTPGRQPNLVDSIKRSSGETVTLALPDLQIDLRRAATNTPAAARGNFKAVAQQLFRGLDPKGKGYVELRELDQRFYQRRTMLEMADADGDGRVKVTEVEELLELQAEAAGLATTLGVADLGRGLFEILDANKDGRLSGRELRSSWDRLSACDHDGDAAVALDEIPYQFQLAAGRGPNVPLFGRPRNQGIARSAPAPTAGPVWFRKMDRNADGELSPREFLGKADDFKRIDANKDGYVSLEEAEAADTRLRKTSARKP